MASKNKSNRQRKQSAKFAIKGPTSALKKSQGVDRKSNQHVTNIDINIKTKSLTVLSGKRRRGQVLTPAPSSSERITNGSKTEISNLLGREKAVLHHRKKTNQEWNSNYENLLERGYAATLSVHSSAGKRRCSNRKHIAASSQESVSGFHFQAAAFSAEKTPHEILNDTTSALSTIHLIPPAKPHSILEAFQSMTAIKAEDHSVSLTKGEPNHRQASSGAQTTNRFQLLNDDVEDGNPGDSKQSSCSFAFHPPSFSLTPELSLPTALLSKLRMHNTTEDIDPDL